MPTNEKLQVSSFQAPDKRWETFFVKLGKFATTPIEQWKHLDVLGYFCYRYQDHFKRSFSFTFKTVPSKTPELYHIKCVYSLLVAIEPSVVKDYIDWIFDNEIIPNKRSIRSIGFLQNQTFANQFLSGKTTSTEVTRSTPVPKAYQPLAEANQIEVSTYNDLVMIYLALQQDSTSDYRQPYKKLLDSLYQAGLSESTLQSLAQ